MSKNIQDDDPFSIFKSLDKNLEKYLSPNEVIKHFEQKTNHNEMVGQIISIEGPVTRRNKKTGKDVDVINLEVRINDPTKVAIAIWGDEIPRLKSSLKNGHVVLFESLFVTVTEKSRFNFFRGINVSCQNVTQIYSLNDMNQTVIDRTMVKTYTEIQQAVNESEEYPLVCLQAYLKINFVKKSGKLIGAISDDKVNMETWIITHDTSKDIQEGQYLKMYGKFIETENRIHFSVNDFNDIEILDVPKASILQLYKTLESPKKKRRVEIEG